MAGTMVAVETRCGKNRVSRDERGQDWEGVRKGNKGEWEGVQICKVIEAIQHQLWFKTYVENRIRLQFLENPCRKVA